MIQAYPRCPITQGYRCYIFTKCSYSKNYLNSNSMMINVKRQQCRISVGRCKTPTRVQNYVQSMSWLMVKGNDGEFPLDAMNSSRCCWPSRAVKTVAPVCLRRARSQTHAHSWDRPVNKRRWEWAFLASNLKKLGGATLSEHALLWIHVSKSWISKYNHFSFLTLNFSLIQNQNSVAFYMVSVKQK